MKAIEIYNPKTVFANKDLLKAMEEEQNEIQRKKYPCSACKAKGEIKIECDRCEGSGETPIKCENCEGTGIDKND